MGYKKNISVLYIVLCKNLSIRSLKTKQWFLLRVKLDIDVHYLELFIQQLYFVLIFFKISF